jgi:osmotically inducible protein OsmC
MPALLRDACAFRHDLRYTLSYKLQHIAARPFLLSTGGRMKRNASAVWTGGLKDGKGAISTDSGVLKDTQYSFSTRFEDGIGTNPEELIAAAHAGCFSMALSGQLGQAGLTAESIRTTASVKLEKTDAGFAITSVHLDVTAKVPGADRQKFETAANNAKAGCPVSKLLNAEITMEARLEE